MERIARRIFVVVCLSVLISVASPAALPDMKPETLAQRSPVTWQSAFWSLIPLALNSMTQPAGMVCFLPSEYGAILRCSPVICCLDTIVILEQQIWLTITNRSPFTAAKQFVRFRFQDAECEAAENSFASLKKNTSFRIVVFIFGALPQIIKLYSMTGLFWTKIVGWTYLISFLIIEVVNLAAWKIGERGRLPLPRDTTLVEDYIGFASVAASILFAFYVFALGSVSAGQAYLDRFKWWHVLLLVLLIPIYVIANLSQTQSESFLDFLLLTSLFSSALLGAWFSSLAPLPFNLSKLDPNLPGNMPMTVAAIVSAHLALLLVGLAGYNIYRNTDARRLKFFKFAFPWLYIVLHVDASLLYFVFGYDSMGTSKPAWADLLG